MATLTAIIAALKAIPALVKLAELLERIAARLDRNRTDRDIDAAIDRLREHQQRDSPVDGTTGFSSSGDSRPGMVPGRPENGEPPRT